MVEFNHERLLSQLVEIRSYSGGEKQLKLYIQDWFEEGGIPTIEQGNNLLVHFKGKNSSKCFILNSHMDTVSAGDPEKWTYGPWKPTKQGEKLFGLGTSDMKSGLAASILVADRYFKQRELPPIDLWFTFVEKEEVDGSGTASFAEWFEKTGYYQQYQDLAGIFTEPTGLTEIEHGHRGNLFIKATTYGDSGHTSRPLLLKTHSVKEMFKFSDTLEQAFEKWREEFKSNIFEPPTVGILTTIHTGIPVVITEDPQGEPPIPFELLNNLIKTEIAPNVVDLTPDNPTFGDSPNKFPPSCTATFDIRTTPEFYEVALERIKELGEKHGVEIDLAAPAAPAGYTDPSEKIVQVAQRVTNNAKLTVSQASADLGFLSAKGVKAIILGPGEKAQCHITDEYCYPSQIPQAVEIYRQIIEGWAK